MKQSLSELNAVIKYLEEHLQALKYERAELEDKMANLQALHLNLDNFIQVIKVCREFIKKTTGAPPGLRELRDWAVRVRDEDQDRPYIHELPGFSFEKCSPELHILVRDLSYLGVIFDRKM